MFFPLHFPLYFSREPNKKQKEILQIGTLLPTPTTHPWQCSPPHNSKQKSQPKSTIISFLHLPINLSRVIPVWPNMLAYSMVEESHCHVVAIHQTWLFASHCHVVTTQIWVLCWWHNRLIMHRSTPRTPKEKPSHRLHPISTKPLSSDFLPMVRDVLYLESSVWFFFLSFWQKMQKCPFNFHIFFYFSLLIFSFVILVF